jgi:hypothetical protein
MMFHFTPFYLTWIHHWVYITIRQIFTISLWKFWMIYMKTLKIALTWIHQHRNKDLYIWLWMLLITDSLVQHVLLMSVNSGNRPKSFTSNLTTKELMLSTSTTSSTIKTYSPVFRITLRWNPHLVFHTDILPLLPPSFLITNKRCSAQTLNNYD